MDDILLVLKMATARSLATKARNSFHFVLSGFGRMRCGRWWYGRGYLRCHLRHLVEAAARGPMLVRGIMRRLTRTRLEMRLLLGVISAYRRHVPCLLSRIHRLPRLPRRHEHGRLGRLTRLGILMHHHWGTPARARESAMRLRWRRMLRVSVTGIGRIHLHLRGIRSHALGNSHERATGRLLDHHGCCHSSLWINKLRGTRVVPHMRGRRCPLVHVKLRHGLLEPQLRMRGHRGWVGNMVVL